MLHWFLEISPRSEQCRFLHLHGIIDTRTHDHFQPRLQFQQTSQGLQSVQSRHLQVKHDHLRNRAAAHALQRLYTVSGGFDTIRIEFQHHPQIAEHVR